MSNQQGNKFNLAEMLNNPNKPKETVDTEALREMLEADENSLLRKFEQGGDITSDLPSQEGLEETIEPVTAVAQPVEEFKPYTPVAEELKTYVAPVTPVEATSNVEEALNQAPKLETDIEEPIAKYEGVFNEEPLTAQEAVPSVQAPSEVTPEAPVTEATPQMASVKRNFDEEEEAYKGLVNVEELAKRANVNLGVIQGKNTSVVNDRKILESIDDINLENLEVSPSKNILHISNFMSAAFVPKSTYQVVLLRSGYVAQMTGLRFYDRDVLESSESDILNYYKKKFRVIYDHIANTSVGHFTFDEFLKLTAYSDFETLLFGIYAQTFPNDNEFEVTCNKCGTKTRVKTRPNQLLQFVDREAAYEKVLENISKQYERPMQLLNDSLVSKVDRILLPESKIVFDVITPTLHDYLNYIGRTIKKDNNTMNIDKKSETYSAASLYIGNVYLPILEEFRRGNKVFEKVLASEMDEKIRICSSLSSKDGSYLIKSINTRDLKYQIKHKLAGLKCSNTDCNSTFGEINIDVENLLFFSMREEAKNMLGETTN